MTPKRKKTPASPPANPVMRWARQGIQSFVAARKTLLDLVAQENVSLVGLADMGVRNFTSAGRILLDLAAGGTALVVDGVKEGLRLPAVGSAVAEVARHRVDTIVGMQKHLLDKAAEQTHAMAESYQEGKGLMAGARVVELARGGIEGFVENEKKFYDLAAHEISAATKGEKPSGKPRERVKVLTELARQGGEKYIDAQKKLLELAIKTVSAEKSRRDLTIKPKRRMARAETHTAGPRAGGTRMHVKAHKTPA